MTITDPRQVGPPPSAAAGPTPAATSPQPARSTAPIPRGPAGGEAVEIATFLSSAFTILALLCVWFLLQVVVLSGAAEARSQRLLYDRFRTEVAAQTAPMGPVVKPGRPVALLSVPGLGASVVVVEGTAAGDLLAGPGHRRNTVLPGQQGVSLVYSRGLTYGAPLGDIARLPTGSPILVTTGQGQAEYHVVGIRHAGDPLRPLPTGTAGRITITTTEGVGAMSRLQSNSVVYVDADTTKAFPAPGGRPSQVPPSEQAMATDRGALPMLVLALALLLGCVLVVSAARRRWSAALVWVVTTPVAVALAWFTTEAVVRVLPNLM